MLTLVPTPIGNLEDITLRALRALEVAEIVLCEDTRVAKRLLQLLSQRHGLQVRADTFLSLHSHNETMRLETLDTKLFERNVVYMSDAGMPAISDPGAALVAWCKERGINYTVLPGPSAFATAYAASGFPQTQFLFYGFLPHKGRAREIAMANLLRQPWPVVLYEAPHRLEKLLQAFARSAPERILFLAKEISKKHERYLYGDAKSLLERIAGAMRKGEWVVIVPPAEADERDVDVEAVLAMDMPPKEKAKLLAEATGRSVGVCYEMIVAGKGKF